MTEQSGHDSHSEQNQNGERKGVEIDFAMQLQERLQTLAERNNSTEFMVGFATRFEGDAEGVGFEVTATNCPGKRKLDVRFAYGKVHGTLSLHDKEVSDIQPDVYDDSEAHLVDWGKMVNDQDIPESIRLISQRMQGLTSDREQAQPMDEKGIAEMVDAVWETGREIGSPIIYTIFQDYKTPLGEVHINAFSDMANSEGEFLPDNMKPGSLLMINRKGFRYTRQATDGRVSDYFSEEIDWDNLPPLTNEERKRHPYVVIPAEQGVPHRNSDEVSFDENGQPADMRYRTDGYTVISANVSGAVTMKMQTWYDTEEEAQAWADKLYQIDLAHEHQDNTMNPERQKMVLDALDAALLATELEER